MLPAGPEEELVTMSSQNPLPETCSLADSMGLGMEPLTFPEEESADLEEFLDDTLFSFPFEEEQWADCLLDDGFQVDVSIPFDDFGSDYAPAFAEEAPSNPQSSDGVSATASGNGSVSGVDESNVEMISGSPPPPPLPLPSSSSSSSPPSPEDSSSDHSTVDDQRKRKREAEDCNKHGLISSSDTTEAITNSSSRSRCTGDEDEKRKARLMRNRESAQLSRQRKKSYIDELEEKVKSMNSTIAELNNTIAFMNAENIKLKQQLGVLCQAPNTANQHTVAPFPMPYPWPPYPAYPGPVMGVGNGGRVPLLPLPRLKSHSQQPSTPCKDRKPLKSPAAAVSSEQKLAKKRIKKVASVVFLGFFFFIFFLLGRIGQLLDAKDLIFRESSSRELLGNSIEELTKGGLLFKPGGGGRVLTSWDKERNFTEVTASNNHLGDVHLDMELGPGRLPGSEKRNDKRNATFTDHYTDSDNDRMKMNSYIYPENNSSTALVASLFVPRNDKLVKIDGNLIIHSVLAGEEASRSLSASQSRCNKDGHVDNISLKTESEKNSLAVRTERQRALAAAAAATTDSGRNVDTSPEFLGNAAENPNYRALASNFRTSYREDMESTAVDRSLQQWFQEGLAGPVLSSGMCTEVFQFDASPNSPSTTANSKIVTSVASRIANNSGGQSSNNSSGSKINEAQRSAPVYPSKNRRVSYAVPLPPARAPLKDIIERNFTDHAEIIHEERGYRRNNTAPSSMVVSILVDPRETSDDGMLSSGSLSRIFVVVLVDSVKYVTYSCVLPSKGSGSHLVTR